MAGNVRMSENPLFGHFRTIMYVRNVRDPYSLGHSDMIRTSDTVEVSDMDKVEIGTIGEWQVRVIPWPSYSNCQAWWTVQVKHQDAKGGYWLNWNGERFAKGSALLKIAQRYPELERRLHEIFKAWSGTKAHGT